MYSGKPLIGMIAQKFTQESDFVWDQLHWHCPNEVFDWIGWSCFGGNVWSS